MDLSATLRVRQSRACTENRRKGVSIKVKKCRMNAREEIPCGKKVSIARIGGELRVEGVEVSVRQFIEQVAGMNITVLKVDGCGCFRITVNGCSGGEVRVTKETVTNGHRLGFRRHQI